MSRFADRERASFRKFQAEVARWLETPKPEPGATMTLANLRIERARAWFAEVREPRTRDELVERCLAVIFDCGQLARDEANQHNRRAGLKAGLPKQRRLKDVPREAKVAFARQCDGSNAYFELYSAMVGNVAGLIGDGAEAERLCEERFVKGFRKRYRNRIRSKCGNMLGATIEENAIAGLTAIATEEGDGGSAWYPSRTKRAQRKKAKLGGVKVTLRYAKPDEEIRQKQVRRQISRR